MISSRSGSLLALGALLLLPGCRGGPGVKGVEAASLFRSYSAVWLLDEASGEVPRLDEEPPEPPPGEPRVGGRGGTASPPDGLGPTGSPGRGGTLGLPGTLRGRAGSAGDPVPPYPGRWPARNAPAGDGSAAAAALARVRPSRITLILSDSLLVAHYADGRRTEVPMNGREVEVENGSWPTRARVEWKDRQPSLRWMFDGGSEVRDRFELLASGRLLVTRTLIRGPDTVEARFFYRREAAER